MAFVEKVLSIDAFYNNLNDNLTFVSPSANYGTYEKKFYEALCKHIKTVVLFCSDLANLSSYESPISDETSKFIHLGGGINALDCFKNINSKANIIFDMKGALWHLNKKDKIRLLEV